MIAGVDEAGRGPLAGPVVAACVILPENYYNTDIKDSKSLSNRERTSLSDIIKNAAVDYSIVHIDNHIIDEINILQATFKAMKTAVENLRTIPDLVYIDGNRIPNNLNTVAKAIVKGDSLIQVISAASILAKVDRDYWMVEIAHELYPEYGFDKHKGYATNMHYEALVKYGICPIHRKSFLKKFFNQQISMF